MTAVAIIALVIAIVALSIATGVSLGRNGDREDEYHYREQMDEALGQLDDRLRALEPPPPHPPSSPPPSSS
jgi:hypothetical protein